MLPVLRAVGCGKALLAKVQVCCLWNQTQRALMTSSYVLHQAASLDVHNRNSSRTCLHTGVKFPSSCHRRDFSSVALQPLWLTACSFNQVAVTGGIVQHKLSGLNGMSPWRANSAQQFHKSSCVQVIQDEPAEPVKMPSWWRRRWAELQSAPTPALVLGFSGLIPFMLPALYSIMTMSCGPNIAFAQVAYGACILSFLGGVRWGHTVSPTRGAATWPALTFSVLPSLIAWMGLMMPIQPGLLCIISGMAFAGIADTRFKSYPVWFRSLRFILTTFAILSISVTFGFSILFPPPEEPEHGYNFRKLIKIARIIVED